MAQTSSDLGRFNLVVVGRPGSGRSSLIAAVFGSAAVPDGPGKPIAPGVAHFSHPDGVLGVYRVPEDDVTSAAGAGALAAVAEVVAQASTQPLPEQVHAAWYVVRWGTDAELTAGQADFIRGLANILPVVFVVTAVPANLAGHPDQEAVRFARYVQSHLLPLSPENRVYLTNARVDLQEGSALHGSPLHGLHEVAVATFATSPEAARRALTAAAVAQRQRFGPGLPLTSIRVRAQHWQQETAPLRSAVRAYWARFRSR